MGSHFFYSKFKIAYDINEMGSHGVLLYCTLIVFFIGLKMTVYGRNV